MARRKQDDAIDWVAIERHYRIGQKSNLQLGAEYGVDPSGIGKRAKKYGWVQDKRQEVEQTTNSLLIQAASGRCDPNSTPNPTEIKVAAHAAADVVLEHRQGLRRLKKIHADLLAQMEGVVSSMTAIEEIVLMVRNPDERGVDRANDAMRRAMERPQLVEDLKKLADIDERVRKGEREAFDLDKDDKKSSVYEDMLEALGRQAAQS
jgi:hypothetical protein